MAAQEYYLGTAAAHELQGSQPPNPYPPQPPKPPQYQQPPAQPPRPHVSNPPYVNTPPPSYSAYSQPPQQSYGYPPQQQQQQHQQHQFFPEKKNAQAMTAPYPQTPPAGGYYPPQQPMPQNNGYLGAPLQPYRSHSQPARVRFADQDSDRSTSLGSMSDSDDYSPPRHRDVSRHHHHHSHSTRDYSSDRDRDRSRNERRHKPRKTHSFDKAHEDKHKNRDTFLGAGAGTIIGDVIFPGLGTAAGLVLGGYGGRKYADTRSKSDYAGSERRSHRGSRRAGDDGWDEKTKTYRKGAAVR